MAAVGIDDALDVIGEIAWRQTTQASSMPRTNRRVIAICHDVLPSVCLSVCPSKTGVRCDHTVHWPQTHLLHILRHRKKEIHYQLRSAA